MDVKTRLKDYLTYKKVSQNSFCKALGVSAAYIASIRKSIAPDKLLGIAEYYPDLNISWLLTGQGSMIIDDKLPSSPITAENSIVGDGNSNNNVGSADDSFLKGIITELRNTIADLRSRCSDFERQNQELEKLLNEERERNKQFPIRFID